MKTHIRSSLSLRFLTGLLTAVFASSLLAQTEPPLLPRERENTLKHADSNFLKKAAKSSDEEINISTVAASRTSNPQVRELAQMIANDHQGVGAKLASLAAIKGVQLPAREMGAPKWEKKDGKDFDKDYLKEMVDAHENAVDIFSNAAKSDDAEVAAFASQQLPKLQAHLSRAKELLKTGRY
jgi:putative membrane protein